MPDTPPECFGRGEIWRPGGEGYIPEPLDCYKCTGFDRCMLYVIRCAAMLYISDKKRQGF